MLNTNQSAVEQVTIKTELDEFQVEIAVLRHESLNNKKAVDTNIINILIGLIESNPELIKDVHSHTIPARAGMELEIQNEVTSLIQEKDWQGLFDLSDFRFIDLDF